MRKLIFLILIVLTTSCIKEADVFGTNYYVATNGNNGNPGTYSQPWATWNYGFNHINAGDTLFIRGGTYMGTSAYANGTYNMVYVSGKNGSSSSKYNVFAYPGETPILDCSNFTGNGRRFGIDLESCSYWHIKGLTVCRLPAYNADLNMGFVNHGSHHLTFENCTAHHINGGGFGQSDGGNANLYYRCDAHHCNDPLNSYEAGDGFIFGYNTDHSVTVTCRECRSYHNSDDGYDTYGNQGTVIWDRCWTWGNGQYGGSGDGNGFKFGATTTSSGETVRRIAMNCIAAGNVMHGYCKSESTGINYVYNSISYRNVVGFHFGSAEGSGNTASIIRNNISYNDSYAGFFTSNNIVDHNTWNGGVKFTSDDVVSLDTNLLRSPRKANGALPDIDFFKLVDGSDLIDAGYYVGIAYAGNGPDIGAFEYGMTEEEPNPGTHSGFVVKNNKIVYVIRNGRYRPVIR